MQGKNALGGGGFRGASHVQMYPGHPVFSYMEQVDANIKTLLKHYGMALGLNHFSLKFAVSRPIDVLNLDIMDGVFYVA